MSSDTPRPGSKTEAAIEYLRAHGGAATAIDVAEAIDTERNTLHAIFGAAIERWLVEPCDLPGGAGWRLCGPDAPGTPRQAPERKAKPVAAKAQPETAIMRAKPAKPAKPKKPAKPHPTPTPRLDAAAAPGATFRVGEYSDGSIRIEGLGPEMIITDGAGELPGAVTLSPAAARILVEFLHPTMDAIS